MPYIHNTLSVKLLYIILHLYNKTIHYLFKKENINNSEYSVQLTTTSRWSVWKYDKIVQMNLSILFVKDLNDIIHESAGTMFVRENVDWQYGTK